MGVRWKRILVPTVLYGVGIAVYYWLVDLRWEPGILFPSAWAAMGALAALILGDKEATRLTELPATIAGGPDAVFCEEMDLTRLVPSPIYVFVAQAGFWVFYIVTTWMLAFRLAPVGARGALVLLTLVTLFGCVWLRRPETPCRIQVASDALTVDGKRMRWFQIESISVASVKQHIELVIATDTGCLHTGPLDESPEVLSQLAERLTVMVGEYRTRRGGPEDVEPLALTRVRAEASLSSTTRPMLEKPST